MEADKTCCICGKKTEEKILSFDDTNIPKFKLTLARRKIHGLKYQDVNIPEEINSDTGYHASCGNRFNALKKQFRTEVLEKPASTENPESNNISDEESACADDDDVRIGKEDANNGDACNESEICVFCDKAQKRYKNRYQKLYSTDKYNTFDNVCKYATIWNDLKLLNAIMTLQGENKKIFYHNFCKQNYMDKTKQAERPADTEWHKTRECYLKAFKVVVRFINRYVIQNKNACTLQFVQKLFREALIDEVNKEDNVNLSLYTRHISEKIKKRFKKKIKFQTYHRSLIIFPSGTFQVNMDTLSDIDIVQKAALILRREIIDSFTGKLKKPIQIEDLMKGECTYPEILKKFLTTLIAAFNYKKRSKPKTLRLVDAFSADLTHAVNSKILPSKHILLGSAMKSLTNSKKIINILHRYGHSCSYVILEELETEATYASIENNKLCPVSVLKGGGLKTGCAFDNFNRFMETSGAKTTLDDTVAIVFQDIPLNAENDNQNNAQNDAQDAAQHDVHLDSALSSRKRRRTYEGFIPTIPIYSKKPRIEACLLPYDSELRPSIPQNFNKILNIDLCWMLSHFVGVETPMWVGFNAKFTPNNDRKQRVSYLMPINQSPTDKSVVLETMRRAVKIADECNEQYAHVTYDLGIGMLALPMQNTELNEFKRLFIQLGDFHIMMAYIKALGSFLSNCGVENILVESELIGSGSINTFLSGKAFNKCKRLHMLMYVSFQMLQFESFLEIEDTEVDADVISFFTRLKEHPSTIVGMNGHVNLNSLLERFKTFQEDTLAGLHGKTPQFYALYMQLVHYFLLFDRSIRTADFDLYIFTLEKMNNLFFTFNQINYSRWLVWYIDTLLNMDKTHPGLKEQFRDGRFGIKRTDKPFSRVPIDLTLEQTINADAGRKLTGISHITNSISARQRWSINHGLRCTLISAVMEQCGLKPIQDVTNDLMHHRIKRSNVQINTFTAAIKDRINPFSTSVAKDNLVNICTGQCAPDDVADFMLNVEKIGEEKRKYMINKCAEDPQNFQQYVVKKTKILNFASITKKKPIIAHGKVQEIKMQRDLFGRLLGISLFCEETVNIEKMLTYPLTPVPLSMCHLDGSINKTDKSVLCKIIEKENLNNDQPQSSDILIIDGCFMLHLLKQIPQKFGQISFKILHSITSMNNYKKIFIIFDKYIKPSIKDNEHLLRDNFERDYVIQGPEQNRPGNFSAELKNIKFKEALIAFLMDHWSSEGAENFIEDKEIYVSYDKCLRYTVNEGKVVCQIVPEYRCEGHLEADTKIVFFLRNIEPNKEVVVQCSDTDILVIILGNMAHLPNSPKIWLEFGTGNHRRFISINAIYEKLGHDICRGLPAFHAFTGCDFNPAFFKIGKKKPWLLYAQSQRFQKAFQAIQDPDSDDYRTAFDVIEEFVCQLYATSANGLKTLKLVNEARLELFIHNYGTIEATEQFKKKLLNFDPCSLPPCQRELKQHILRTSYIGNMWSNAHASSPTNLVVTNHGWLLENDSLTFNWFEGEELPECVADILISNENEASNDDNEQPEGQDVNDWESDENSGTDSEEDDDEDDELSSCATETDSASDADDGEFSESHSE